MPSFLLKELYMRIDKYISGCGYASRKDVKKLIKQGLVFIDGEVCKKPEEQTDEDSIVEVDGERLIYREFVYLMLNSQILFLLLLACYTQLFLYNYLLIYYLLLQYLFFLI